MPYIPKQFVTELMYAIQHTGYEVYIVGGLPRDEYLKVPYREEADYDLVTTASVAEIEQILNRIGLPNYRVIGNKHKIIQVKGVEISTLKAYVKQYPTPSQTAHKLSRKKQYQENQRYRNERCRYEDGHVTTGCMLCDDRGYVQEEIQQDSFIKNYVGSELHYDTDKGTKLVLYVRARNQVDYVELQQNSTTGEMDMVDKGRMKIDKHYGVDYLRQPLREKVYVLNRKHINGYYYNRPSYRVREDSRMRDFTINTGYVNADGETFFLHPKAQQDLQDGIIRFVESPKARIAEDPSRVIRAIQLASRFQFKLSSGTEKAIRGNEEAMNATPPEVLGKNLMKVLKQGEFPRFFRLLHKMKLAHTLLPHLAEVDTQGMEEAYKRMEATAKAGGSLEEQWQSLYQEIGYKKAQEDKGRLAMGKRLK